MTLRVSHIAPALAGLLSIASTALAQAKAPGPRPTVAPFETLKINEFTWYGRFGFTNCSWLDMGDGILVIDTGATVNDAANLAAQIKEKTGKPIKWFVLTHLHSDSNGGLRAFMPTDATIFVNTNVAAQTALALHPKDADPKGKYPSVVGVTDKAVIVSGGHILELGTPVGGGAHTDHDLYAYSPESGVMWVGDLVTPARCPMMSDPSSDPKGWIATLERLKAAKAAVIIPTRNDATQLVNDELQHTSDWIKRTMDLLKTYRQQNFPEAKVSGELTLHKSLTYCPSELDTINALSIYKRMGADGKVGGVGSGSATAKPPVKKKPAK